MKAQALLDQSKLSNIAILGGGPIGIEAALYARSLGYPTTVFERGSVAANVQQWSHVQLFTPFQMNSSSLGRSVLRNQNPKHDFPDLESLHSGGQWRAQYLQPLIESDLLNGSFQSDSQVKSVARMPGEDRSDAPFLLMITDENNNERFETADVVIDATGTSSNPNSIGIGGGLAIGESSIDRNQDECLFTNSIVTQTQLESTIARNFVVIGSGYSAATNVLLLKKLHERDPAVRCTWVTRRPNSKDGPVHVVPDDPLLSRIEITEQANELALESNWLTWKPGTQIKAINQQVTTFQLELTDGTTVDANHVFANVGYQGDYKFLGGLNIHRCYVSGGPMAWAASIAGQGGDCLNQSSTGPTSLLTTEPNFFVIGAKSYGTDPRFLFSTGLQQIRDIFTIISGRDQLDLYASESSRIQA